jgi:hypothetical protein
MSIDLKGDQRFVLDGVEVKLTGRTAKKPSTMSTNVMLIMYEVCPADEESIQFKKWAKEADLYIID